MADSLIWLDQRYTLSVSRRSGHVLYRRWGADQHPLDYLHTCGPSGDHVCFPIHWRDPGTDALVCYRAGFTAVFAGKFIKLLTYPVMFIRNGDDLAMHFDLPDNETIQIPLLNWNRK